MTRAWWHDGIRFACQGSGKCCVSRGAYGYVYLTSADRRRLAAALGMPTREFTRSYCDKTDGYFHLRETGIDCRFLEQKRCSVYDARPDQCRSWPFWPENMSPKAWAAIAAECPGVGKGAVVPRERVEQTLVFQRRSTARL
ncbi:MAG: YkgJ family cysteine cluster protein [Gammaproteobacteria bacterium]|nr:YkgJ family cysteine cluster protein [Gammaproteobacteria bacterium]